MYRVPERTAPGTTTRLTTTRLTTTRLESISQPKGCEIRAGEPRGRWLRRVLAERRGSVTLEFVLSAPVLLLLLGFMVDFSLLLRVRIAIASGLMNTVQYAMTQGPSVTAANLVSVMQTSTPLNGLAASVAGPGCYCPSAYPVTLTAATCGATCPTTGAAAGTYVIVTGTYSYVPIMPGMSRMVSTTVVQTATAKLQ